MCFFILNVVNENLKPYIYIYLYYFCPAAYLAAVNAVCGRAPMISTALSDGQFYSPPESLAGNITH